MGAVLILAGGPVDEWIAADLWTRVTWLLAAVGGGGLIYALVILVLGLRPRDFRLADVVDTAGETGPGSV